MRAVFLLGANEKLSRAELESYFAARGVEFSELESGPGRNPWLLAQTGDFQPGISMLQLGGCVKIARVIDVLPADFVEWEDERISEQLEKIGIGKLAWDGWSDIRRVGVSVYSETEIDWDGIASTIGSAAAHQLKPLVGKPVSHITAASAHYRKGGGAFIPSELWSKFGGEHASEAVELNLFVGRKCYLAKTEAMHDPDAEQERGDALERPRGWRYGMRPRLAKILVNLSRAKEGDMLLDPFCGIGTILQEAMLNGINVIGRDIDPLATGCAARNAFRATGAYNVIYKMRPGMRMGRPRPSADVKRGDARALDLRDESVDAVATEPALGPSVTKRPSAEAAEAMVRKLDPLYEAAVGEIGRVLKPGRRAAVVLPLIRTASGETGPDMKRIAARAGLHFTKPIIEAGDWQVVQRAIWVLRKE